MSERVTEDIVLSEMQAVLGENDFGFVFPQGQTPDLDKVNKALKQAGGKPKYCQLNDYSQGGCGKAQPEYIITFNKPHDTIMVVECKNSIKRHQSEHLDNPKDYAVDGALYYAKFLKQYYNVIVLAVSGTKKDTLKVSTFFWKKNFDTYQELSKGRDTLYTPVNYLNLVQGKTVEKAISIEEIRKLALVMHDNLRALKMTERMKPVFIAGILIALKNQEFAEEYQHINSFTTLLTLLQKAIDEELSNSDIRREKINDIKAHFKAVGKNLKLKDIPLGHYNSLLWYIEQLENKIKPMMDYSSNTVDALGIFYHEFVKYSGGDGSGLGIVLTPQHLTEFMVDLAEVNKSSKVVDICCGSGAFLVTAMSKMFQSATEKEIAHIKTNSLFGVESDDDIYTLAIANMIVRGDGKSNIIYGDCFDKQIIEKLKEKHIDVGLINPPYSQKDHVELEFVENLLDILTTGGRGVVVVPMSCAIGTKFKEVRERLFKKHTLKAVFSMPDDIFYSNNASTNVCVMVWEAHKPHDSQRNTFFGFYKDDGFVKSKKLGRIDKFNKWQSIKEEWISLYRENDVKKGMSAKHPVSWQDEWLCEAYMETDYSTLKPENFEQIFNDYLAFLIKVGKMQKDSLKHQLSNTANWQYYPIRDLFTIARGTRLTKENRVAGHTPLVTAGAQNEGVSDFIQANKRPLYKDALTIDMFCNCFYHEYSFSCDDNILVLSPKFKQNKFNALFIATVVNQEKNKYAYGRQYRQKDFNNHFLKLPSKKINGKYEPDWQYMENYIKNLPYGDLI